MIFNFIFENLNIYYLSRKNKFKNNLIMLVVNILINYLLNVCSVLCLIFSVNIGRKEKKNFIN